MALETLQMAGNQFDLIAWLFRTAGSRPMATPESATVILGLPIPSANPLFLAIVGIHVMFGLAAVVSGVLAMLSSKGRGRHVRFGTIYFRCLFAVFATMSAMSFMRWSADYPLFTLGALSFASGYIGRAAARGHWPQWPRLHLTGMGASYILMLTAFYVDNGSNLPLWRELPEIAFWVLPSVIGGPLIAYALYRHPLVLASGRPRPSDGR
jgi:hypothetical protein